MRYRLIRLGRIGLRPEKDIVMAGAACIQVRQVFPVVALRAKGTVVALGAIANVLRENDFGEVATVDDVRRAGKDARQAGAIMDLVDHHLEIDRYGRLAGLGNPRTRVVASDAQPGVDASAMRREPVMALIAGGRHHNFATDTGA